MPRCFALAAVIALSMPLAAEDKEKDALYFPTKEGTKLAPQPI